MPVLRSPTRIAGLLVVTFIAAERKEGVRQLEIVDEHRLRKMVLLHVVPVREILRRAIGAESRDNALIRIGNFLYLEQRGTASVLGRRISFSVTEIPCGPVNGLAGRTSVLRGQLGKRVADIYRPADNCIVTLERIVYLRQRIHGRPVVELQQEVVAMARIIIDENLPTRIWVQTLKVSLYLVGKRMDGSVGVAVPYHFAATEWEYCRTCIVHAFIAVILISSRYDIKDNAAGQFVRSRVQLDTFIHKGIAGLIHSCMLSTRRYIVQCVYLTSEDAVVTDFPFKDNGAINVERKVLLAHELVMERPTLYNAAYCII